MEKLRLETLDDILKKEKAYPHELRAIIPELKMLREIYDGKIPPPNKETMYMAVPTKLIADDNHISPGSALELLTVGGFALIKSVNYVSRRYVVFRVK